LDAEYGEDEFVRRIVRIARGMGEKDARKVLRQIHHLHSSQMSLVHSDSLFRKVKSDIAAIRPALVEIDPLRNHLDGDENESGVVKRAYKCLDELRGIGRCPVLAPHHLNKSGHYSGSRAIATMGDLLIEGTDVESPVYTANGRKVRSKDPIAGPFQIEVSHENDEDDAIAATRVTLVTAKKADPAITWHTVTGKKILEFLATQKEPRAANYIAKAVSCSGKAAKKELAELMMHDRVDGSGFVTFNGQNYPGFRYVQPGRFGEKTDIDWDAVNDVDDDEC
jgi:hypothetical protein